MALWIPITLAAAFMQNIRSALQKRLSDTVGTGGATYARFVFALPLALLYVYLMGPGTGSPLPAMNTSFFIQCLIGGTSQVLATAALIHSFSFRNFAVGTTYSKTEAIQTAVFGFLILGEGISAVGTMAIIVSFFGVLVLSAKDKDIGIKANLKAMGQPAALYGLASGGLFGISAVMYRGASLSLEGASSVFLAASLTLAVVLVWQTALMSAWFAFRDRQALIDVFKAWKLALPIGVTGMVASVGWFTAMALYNAAYVRALGQVELLFTLAASVLFFGEKVTRREIGGMILVAGGLVLMILYR
jgi:drug/metabolite transporter (DMT)-like permease